MFSLAIIKQQSLIRTHLWHDDDDMGFLFVRTPLADGGQTQSHETPQTLDDQKQRKKKKNVLRKLNY